MSQDKIIYNNKKINIVHQEHQELKELLIVNLKEEGSKRKKKHQIFSVTFSDSVQTHQVA